VAGFVDFSAKGGHDRAVLIGLGVFVGGFGLLFFDIVDGRKRSAGGGALRFGWFGAFGCRIVRTKERWLCFKRATRSVLDFGLWPGERGNSSIQRPPGGRSISVGGHWESKAQCFKLESLILAQNERWRQA
jgi:hypothetical protein